MNSEHSPRQPNGRTGPVFTWISERTSNNEVIPRMGSGHGGTAPGAGSFNCPQCGSAKLRRSHSRGPNEKFQKLVQQLRAYRCKDCGWRGLIKTKNHKSRITPSGKGYSISTLIFVTVLLLLAIFLSIYLVRWMEEDYGRERVQSSISNAHSPKSA